MIKAVLPVITYYVHCALKLRGSEFIFVEDRLRIHGQVDSLPIINRANLPDLSLNLEYSSARRSLRMAYRPHNPTAYTSGEVLVRNKIRD